MNIFPKWANWIPTIVGITTLIGGGLVCFGFWYWASPKNLVIGYQPRQPIAYSHALHVGQLGIDCRFCHTAVETSAHATLPPTETCMKCHKTIKKESPEIQKLTDFYQKNQPIPWVKVHQLPDYSYFDHSIHVHAGMSCKTCHGRIDQMDVVHQVQPLSMGWCLECHRAPEKFVGPRELVTAMAPNEIPKPVTLTPEMRKVLVNTYHLSPREACSTCHR